MLSRRVASGLLAAAVLGMTAGAARAADKVIRIGVNLSLTGADAEFAARIRNGILMAFDELNASRALRGYRLEPLTLDDATAAAGQFDPGRAADNARTMAADREVVAAIGPMTSGAGKAMAPILSKAGLAIITPSSTNADITDPKFASQYQPAGKPIYFRTVPTDAYQGSSLASYFIDKLQVKSVYLLDDAGAYGIGLVDSFQHRAEEKGIKVLGRDRLDAKAADYGAVLSRIKALNPDALYYGGASQAGVKLAKQSYEVVPRAIKGGGDAMYAAEMLSAVGFPAANGWYVTIAAPHTTEEKAAEAWVSAYREKYSMMPSDYALTAYDAALVIGDAVKRLLAEGKEINRETMRGYIQAAKVKTLQGLVSFDENGDLQDPTVSIFQIKKDANYAADDMVHQYHYVGVGPQ